MSIPPSFIKDQASSPCHDFLLLFFHNIQIISHNMTSKWHFEFEVFKSTHLLKETLLLMMFAWRFHIKKTFRKKLEHDWKFYLSIRHAAKKYYILSMPCFQIHWAVFMKTFYFALILKSDLLSYRWKPFTFQEGLVSFETVS